MCSFHFLKPRYRYYADPPQRTGAGVLSNDRITMCKICRKNGFPNEPIAFIRHSGKWQPVNFFDGNNHQHKYRTEQQVDT